MIPMFSFWKCEWELGININFHCVRRGVRIQAGSEVLGGGQAPGGDVVYDNDKI